MKLNAKQLREGLLPTDYNLLLNEKNEIYIILDNVLDTYNIGSIFRLADAVGAKKVFLCGATATPPNPRIKKASINTMEIVEWEYAPDAVEVIRNLKKLLANHSKNKQSLRSDDLNYCSNEVRTNLQVVAVEQSNKSIPYDKFDYKLPLALVVGNETVGVSKEVLEICDSIVELPMFGVNISLNVMVSLGIVLYKIIENACPERSAIWRRAEG